MYWKWFYKTFISLKFWYFLLVYLSCSLIRRFKHACNYFKWFMRFNNRFLFIILLFIFVCSNFVFRISKSFDFKTFRLINWTLFQILMRILNMTYFYIYLRIFKFRTFSVFSAASLNWFKFWYRISLFRNINRQTCSIYEWPNFFIILHNITKIFLNWCFQIISSAPSIFIHKWNCAFILNSIPLRRFIQILSKIILFQTIRWNIHLLHWLRIIKASKLSFLGCYSL